MLVVTRPIGFRGCKTNGTVDMEMTMWNSSSCCILRRKVRVDGEMTTASFFSKMVQSNVETSIDWELIFCRCLFFTPEIHFQSFLLVLGRLFHVGPIQLLNLGSNDFGYQLTQQIKIVRRRFVRGSSSCRQGIASTLLTTANIANQGGTNVIVLRIAL
mmetsp:Transcript_17433/g.36114  ORF Transcript_17433/g.36114 Transcript_17433/m.36114 type:complete len:158 (+) Transcript_17433:924-1397(+)